MWAFGYVRNHDRPCAINPDNPKRTLCNLLVQGTAAFSDEPGYTPRDLCGKCRELIEANHLTTVGLDLVVYGTCPVCVGDVPVEGGVVAPHGRWAFRGAQGRVTNTPCDGAGQKPEVDS
jgi:hypothetical protein